MQLICLPQTPVMYSEPPCNFSNNILFTVVSGWTGFRCQGVRKDGCGRHTGVWRTKVRSGVQKLKYFCIYITIFLLQNQHCRMRLWKSRITAHQHIHKKRSTMRRPIFMISQSRLNLSFTVHVKFKYISLTITTKDPYILQHGDTWNHIVNHYTIWNRNKKITNLNVISNDI